MESITPTAGTTTTLATYTGAELAAATDIPGTTAARVELPPGTYWFNITAEGAAGALAQVTELVYLYPGLESVADYAATPLFDLSAATARTFTLAGAVLVSSDMIGFTYPSMTVTATAASVPPAVLNETVPVTMYGDIGIWNAAVPQSFLNQPITATLNISGYRCDLTGTITVNTLTGELNGPPLAVKFLTTNADLTGLAVSAGTLTPAFNPATTSYAVTIPPADTAIDITATKTDVHTSITIDGAPATFGTASTVSGLIVGTNTIPVVVTALNGTTTKTYTITVTR
jgi:hypothetical protein